MSKCIHELFQHRLLQREGCFHDVDLVSGRKRNTITERKKNEEGKVTLAQIPSRHNFLLLNCLYLPTLKKSINLQDKIGLRFAMYHNEQHQKEKVLFLLSFSCFQGCLEIFKRKFEFKVPAESCQNTYVLRIILLS